MAFNQFQHIHHGMNPYGMQMSPQSQPYFGPQTGGLTQEMPIHDMHDFCRKHHMHYVHIHTKKGELLDGIIDEIDNDGVTLIIPIGDMDREDDEERQAPWFYGGYGFYGPRFPYGHFPRRFRRFRRVRYPFFDISRFFFPFFY